MKMIVLAPIEVKSFCVRRGGHKRLERIAGLAPEKNAFIIEVGMTNFVVMIAKNGLKSIPTICFVPPELFLKFRRTKKLP